MIGRTMLDAGTTVLVLAALFTGLLTLAVVLTVAPNVPDAASEIIGKVMEWAGLAFGALLGALGVNRFGSPKPPEPPTPPEDDE